MGLRKNWGIAGIEPRRLGERRLDGLAGRGVDVRRATVTAIDPEARAADLDGVPLEADALVVALGAERDLERIPGLASTGTTSTTRPPTRRTPRRSRHSRAAASSSASSARPIPARPARTSSR